MNRNQFHHADAEETARLRSLEEEDDKVRHAYETRNGINAVHSTGLGESSCISDETPTGTDSAGFGQAERATSSPDPESTRRMPTLRRLSFILPRSATWAVRPCLLSPAIPQALTCSLFFSASRSRRSRQLYAPGALAGARTRSRSRRVAQEHGPRHVEEQERREGQRRSLEERQEDPLKPKSSHPTSYIIGRPSPSLSSRSPFHYSLAFCIVRVRASINSELLSAPLSSPRVP